jgi:hypothetical protein
MTRPDFFVISLPKNWSSGHSLDLTQPQLRFRNYQNKHLTGYHLKDLLKNVIRAFKNAGSIYDSRHF